MSDHLNILPETWPEETDLALLNLWLGWLDLDHVFDGHASSVEQARWRIQYILGPPPKEPQP